MKHKTLFRLALKVVGVVYVIDGASEIFSQIGWDLQFQGVTKATPWNAMWGLIGTLACKFSTILVGFYFFFGGRWIVNLAIPSNRPYCPECAYDLTGAVEPRCPECGTPFRWEDVKPKCEVQNSKFEKT